MCARYTHADTRLIRDQMVRSVAYDPSPSPSPSAGEVMEAHSVAERLGRILIVTSPRSSLILQAETRRMVIGQRSPHRSPTDSEVTIRPSDPGWRRRSIPPNLPTLVVIPPTPLEGSVYLPDEPVYAHEEDEEADRGRAGWREMMAAWLGHACFVPIKLCLYASRSGSVASRVA